MGGRTYLPCITDISDTGGERYYDLYSRLLKDRVIMLVGEINTDLASSISMQLLILDSDNKEKPIFMYINSPGGAVYDAYMILDVMSYIKCPVYTIGVGFVASAASVILSCGNKGNRLAFENTRIMIHQPHGKAYGQVTDIQIQFEEMSKLKEKLNKLLTSRCKISYEEMSQLTERDTYLDVTRALEIGLIDFIPKGNLDKVQNSV
jgi:ATP-dependent Clp protease protease subunit